MITRRRSLLVVALTVVSALAALGFPTTNGTLIRPITNTTNTAASTVFVTTPNPCTTLANTYNAWFVYPFTETTGPAAVDASTPVRNGTYQNTSGITFNTTGPCPSPGGKSVTLNGSTGYVSGPNIPLDNPNDFTIAIWFKTNTTTGGKLIGFGKSLTGLSSQYDRHIYMQNNGRLTFGVYPGSVKVIDSTASYNDNTWHMAVATLKSSGWPWGRGMRLYVDGNLVAADYSTRDAEDYIGYWRIGYDNNNGWTNQPSSYFFKGSLAYAAYYDQVLDATQVAALYAAG